MSRPDEEAVTVRNVVDLGAIVTDPQVSYAPEVDLATGKLVGFAVSLESTQGPVASTDLIEAHDGVATRGAWLVSRACEDLGGWLASDFPHVRLNVHVSFSELATGETLDRIAEALGVTGVPASLLQITVEEQGLTAGGVVRRDVAGFARLGCRVAVGPFGTAPTRIAALEASGVHTLELDPCLVERVTRDPGARAVVGAVIAMAHALGVAVVAPNVATREQLAFLQKKRCDFARGPQVSPKLEAERVPRWYREWRGGKLRLSA
ncbi:MAG: EAL domain-containing protein [Deltaproteobacteria bacterium]